MTDDQADKQDPAVSSRGRRSVGLVLVVAAVGALVGVGSWATFQGYIPPLTGVACSAEGYAPLPSYDELVTTFGKSPYCARAIRNETWF